ERRTFSEAARQNVGAHGKTLDEPVRLKDDGDPRASLAQRPPVQPGKIDTVEHHLSRRRDERAVREPEKRRLPRSARADEGDALDAQGNAVESGTAAVPLLDVDEFEHSLREQLQPIGSRSNRSIFLIEGD